MKKVLVVFLVLMVFLSAAGQAIRAEGREPDGGSVTIVNEQGEVKIRTNPENVVVFDYGLLDALDSAGVTSIGGVPKSGRLPEHLTKYAASGYVNVGSLKEADYEAIN